MGEIKDIYRTCKECGWTSHYYEGQEHFYGFSECGFCKGEMRAATPEEAEKCRQKDEEFEQRKLNEIFNPTYTPKCPVCGSPNIHKISVTKRVVSGAAFGLFSKTARSQWECSNCGNKF